MISRLLRAFRGEPDRPARAENRPPPASEAPAGGFAAKAKAAAESGLPTAAPFSAEIRIASDGAPYWGPVDNLSSRAKAAGKRLDIDRETCIGCGTCVENTDRVYHLDPVAGKASVIRQEGPMDLVDAAIAACPVTCISWEDQTG